MIFAANFRIVTELDAELIVAGAALFIMCAALLVAERFQLREGFLESCGHLCGVHEIAELLRLQAPLHVRVGRNDEIRQRRGIDLAIGPELPHGA